MRMILTTILLLASISTNAATIDFEEFSTGTSAPLASMGYTFDGGGWDEGNSPASIASRNGSNSFFVSASAQSEWNIGSPASLQFGRTDGQAFALYTLDYQILYDAYGGITARRASDGTWFGTSIAAIGTADWLDIDLVRLNITVDCDGCGDYSYRYGEAYVDNIVVGASVVPIPGAVWLFGSALAGLGWLKRKQIT